MPTAQPAQSPSTRPPSSQSGVRRGTPTGQSAPQSAPRATRRDATENREALLEAAATALRSDPDASLETIAAAAGLTRRSVYGHFATRDELVNAVVIAGAERVARAVGSVRHDDPLTMIALIGDMLWTEVDHVRVMAPLAVRGPLRAVTARALEPVRTLLRDTVAAGVAVGTIRSDIDAATLARLIESAAIAVLEEATQAELTTEDGRRLVMRTTLSIAGLSWREADALAAATVAPPPTSDTPAPDSGPTPGPDSGPTPAPPVPSTTHHQEPSDAR